MSFRQSLYKTVIQTMNEYGLDIIIYRDVYENEVGVKALKKQGQVVGTFKAVIDNSKSNSQSSRYQMSGMVTPQITATVYIPYDEMAATIQYGDYFIMNNLRYTLDLPQDLVHYNLLFQFNAIVNVNE
jgi:hypothetical protein